MAWALRLKLGSSREARWRSGSKWKIPGDAARRQRAVVSIPGFLRGIIFDECISNCCGEQSKLQNSAHNNSKFVVMAQKHVENV